MIERAAWNFRFFAEEQELAGNESFNRDDSLLTYTMRDAAGVFGLITPWNGPFMLSTWKMAPCLAYGNSRRAQAVGTVAIVDARAVRDFQGSRHAGGCLQHGARLRRRSRCAAGRAQGRGRRVVHRFRPDRARHRGARREAAQTNVVRTRRQVGEHHLCGRQSPTSGAGRGDVDLHELGPGVRRRFAHPRAAPDLRGSFWTRSQRQQPHGRRAIRSIAPPASARSSTNVSTTA